MTVVCAILLAVLSSAASALYVAFRYEKKAEQGSSERIANLENEYRGIYTECITCKLEIARNEGISIGRQCDTLQQQMIKSLENGEPVSVRTGRHLKQD